MFALPARSQLPPVSLFPPPWCARSPFRSLVKAMGAFHGGAIDVGTAPGQPRKLGSVRAHCSGGTPPNLPASAPVDGILISWLQPSSPRTASNQPLVGFRGPGRAHRHGNVPHPRTAERLGVRWAGRRIGRERGPAVGGCVPDMPKTKRRNTFPSVYPRCKVAGWRRVPPTASYPPGPSPKAAISRRRHPHLPGSAEGCGLTDLIRGCHGSFARPVCSGSASSRIGRKHRQDLAWPGRPR